MDVKTVVSAKGQIVIPKFVRDTIGIHYGTELIIHMREDQVLEFRPIKKNLSDFFGMGAKKERVDQAKFDVDEAIAEAISYNNPDSGEK